jgi:hypothetical protein
MGGGGQIKNHRFMKLTGTVLDSDQNPVNSLLTGRNFELRILRSGSGFVRNIQILTIYYVQLGSGCGSVIICFAFWIRILNSG